MRSSETASTVSTLASSRDQSSLSSKLKGKLRNLSQSRPGPNNMPLIRPSGGADSETSTLVNYGMSEDNLDSYILEPLPERDSDDDEYLAEENTAWSARRSKKPKVKSQPALPTTARAGLEAHSHFLTAGTTHSNAATSARPPIRALHSK